MNTRTLCITGIILAAILAGGCGDQRPRMPRPDMFKELGLTKSQEQQLEKNRKEQMAMVKKAMAHINILHEKLDQELIKDVQDESRITAIISEIKKEQQVLMAEHFENLLSLRKILTPAQFKKMVMMRQEFQKREKHKNRRGHPGGPGPKHIPEERDRDQPPLVP